MERKVKSKLLAVIDSKGKLWVLALGAFVGVLLLLYGSSSDSTPATAEKGERDLNQYAAELERKLEELCSNVEGVKNAKAAVSFESGFEYVYATNGDKTLTVGNGSSESAVIVTEIPPVIGGIGIVCKGGSNPEVQRRLIELISAVYGVSSNKIYITEAQK